MFQHLSFSCFLGNSTTIHDPDEPLLSLSSVKKQLTSDTIPVITEHLAEGTSTETSIRNETNTEMGIVPTTMLTTGTSSVSAGIKSTEYVSADAQISTTRRTQSTISLKTITSSTPHTTSTTLQTNITATKQPTTSEKTQSTSQTTSVEISTSSVTLEPTPQTYFNTSSTSAAETSQTEPISVSMTALPSTRNSYNSTPKNETLSTTAYATSRVSSTDDETPLTTYTPTKESISGSTLTTTSPVTSSNVSVPIAVYIVIVAVICFTAGLAYYFIKQRSNRRNQRSDDSGWTLLRESDSRGYSDLQV